MLDLERRQENLEWRLGRLAADLRHLTAEADRDLRLLGWGLAILTGGLVLLGYVVLVG